MSTIRYGIPWKGSKNKIANWIVDRLPKGNRLVDLFGGGGAITFCAASRYRYREYLYNDIDPLACNAIRMVQEGAFSKMPTPPPFITKERFMEERRKPRELQDPYIMICFSFGNDNKQYFKKPEKMMRAIEDMEKIQTEFGIYNRIATMKQVRLQNLERLERLERLEITCRPYQDYTHREGDVVYCDIPYENTNQYEISEFSQAEFVEWALSRPYPIYISSYDNWSFKDKFKLIDSIRKRVLFSLSSNIKTKTECLFFKP